MVKILKLAVAIALPFVAGLLGSAVTLPNITTWYAGLEKPFFIPPTWIFGPVWGLLYVLLGVSFYLIWTARYEGSKIWAYVAFGGMLVLNALWSLVFFGLHVPDAGVVVIAVLIGTILAAMRVYWPISNTACILLIPYLLWVGFAMALNVAVAVLN